MEQAIKDTAARDILESAYTSSEQTQQEREEKGKAGEQHKTTNESEWYEVIRQPDQDDSSDKSAIRTRRETYVEIL